MSLSTQDALMLARDNIKAARGARGSKDNAIKYCQVAKDALATIDVSKTDADSAQATIDLYQDLAMVLDESDERLKRKASRYRERAAILRQKLDENVKASAASSVSPFFAGSGHALASLQTGDDRPKSSAGVPSSACSTTFSTTSVKNFGAASTQISLAIAGNTSSTTRQLAPSTSQAVISVSAASGVQSSQSLFSKDVNPVPYLCQLPRPNELLHSTRQLAYCLALLKASVNNDDLSRENLAWRDEKDRLKVLAVQIINEFADNYSEDADAVAEVVALAPVLSDDHFRRLLETFISSTDQSVTLKVHSVDGLAQVIQGAAPGSIDSDDLVSILKSLHKRLQHTHSESYRYRLLLAVSRVLDAMADAQVRDVDRVNLHGPLTDFLRDLESSKHPYVIFQAAYATQALLNVSDDENIVQAAFRKMLLILKGGVSFAKMPDPREVKDMLEGLERLYKASRDGVRGFKKALEAVKTKERPTFTVKDGLKYKKVWYCNLRIAECYIQTGKLVQFKTLVATTTPKCRNHPMFQWGICQLLGRFAADAQWDLEARKDALAFLGELYKVGSIWERQKKTDQVIFDVLTDVAVNNGMRFEITNTLLDEMKRHNTGLTSIADLHFKPWHNRLHSDPAEHTTSKFTLLKAVQNRNLRHAKQENQPDHPPQPKLEELQAALKTYYASHLHILRVSGEELPLETCFVNLAIVEAPVQREKDKQSLRGQAAVFHRITSFEKLEHTNMQSSIPLEQLFDKRMLRNGKEGHPRRILVQGRAGIGKTTLCKKIVHLQQTELWKDRFDAVLWLPLRQLKAFKTRNLEDLFREKFFNRGLDQEGVALAHALANSGQQGRVLYILDGLDEIVYDTECEEGISLREFLRLLLSQRHVIITSRPSGLNRLLLPEIDLELETIGFNQQDVANFVIKILEPEPARAVQNFIQQTPMIQGLVNIPVQLDVICLCWDSLPEDGPTITMTGLYQLMVRKLWCKDALRLGKSAGGKVLTPRQIHQLRPREIDGLVASELQHLGYLAFKGLRNDHQIEFDQDALLSTFDDLHEYRAAIGEGFLSSQVLDMMKQTSFLHTADADLDASKSDSQQAWYFLHLTFQEYFAATWVAQHLQLPIPSDMKKYFASTTSTHHQENSLPVGMMTVERATAFVREHKYNPRYEIMWRMVAGLLEGDALNNFFGLLEGAPRDLIGSRHQQILTACVHEARVRLNSTVVATFDSEFLKWLQFEMRICQYDDYSSSMLGSQISFPEALLLKTLDSVCSWRPALVRTLRARSALSDSAIQSLVAAALKDKEKDVRSAAASTLGKKSRSMDSTIQSAFISISDHSATRFSAALGFSNQFTLTASAMQSLFSALREEKLRTTNPVTSSSGPQSTLSKSTIDTLISALKDENVDVRYSAASILGNQFTLSKKVIQYLITELKSGSDYDRHLAAIALSSRPNLPEEAVKLLIATLNDDSEDVRFSAAEGLDLQCTLSESAINSLVTAFRGKDRRFNSSKASSFSDSPMSQEDITQTLTAALEDHDPNVRYSAAAILGKQAQLPELPLLPLLVALEDDGIYFSTSAASILGCQFELPDSAIQALIEALKDEDEYVRFSAASALRKQSTLSKKSFIESLIATLQNEKRCVRFSAASVLSNQTQLPEFAIHSLTAALKDDDAYIRSSAASVLGSQSTLPEFPIESLTAAPESPIKSLITALGDEDEYVRKSAASALAKQSTLSESSIASILLALSGDNDAVKCSAASALGGQFTLPESAIQSLISALKDKNADVRCSAASSLGKRSTLSGSAIATLISALKDKDENVRYSAASALSKQPTLPESAIPSLSDVLQDQDWALKSAAASALAKYSQLPGSAIELLIALLEDENVDVRSSAASALGDKTELSDLAIVDLIARLRNENEHSRRLVVSVLGNQSKLSHAAITVLTAVLLDEERDVKRSAAAALAKQSILPEKIVECLIALLNDYDNDAGNLAASVLATRSKLTEPAIQALIAVLKGDHEHARYYASEVLLNQCSTLCTVLPRLSKDEIACLYRNYLFRYSSSRVVSLVLQEDRLCVYTEQGLEKSEPLESDVQDVITSAFKAVQNEGGITGIASHEFLQLQVSY